MKKSLIFILMIVAIIGFSPNVLAEEISSCDSLEVNELRKEASNITATYEYVYNNVNEVIGFNYIVYNVPANMYVTYKGIPALQTGDFEDSFILDVDKDTGIGKIFDDNLTDLYTVTFSVYSSKTGCSAIIKTINLNKLKYNKLSELEQCKYQGLEDFIYCQQWIDTKIPFNEAEVIDKIEKYREKIGVKTTTECISCKENKKNDDIYNTIVKVREYAIYGLIAGIVLDLIVMVVLYKKAGEYEL